MELKDIQGKQIVMCVKCREQVSDMEEHVVCKKCSDYDYETGNYFNLVRCERFTIDINTIEKQALPTMEIKFIFGISITRIEELVSLFRYQNFDIKEDNSWKELKRHFFGIVDDSESFRDKPDCALKPSYRVENI